MIIMKKPTDITNPPQVCEECKTNFGKEITVHPVKKEFQGSPYLTWANEDGSSHSMGAEQQYIHVWNDKEKQAAKIGGSALVKPIREEQGISLIPKEGGSSPAPQHMPDKKFEKPFQYELIGEDDRSTAEVIMRQIFELKHLAREVAIDYSNDDLNPASIGQVARVVLEAMKEVREKEKIEDE